MAQQYSVDIVAKVLGGRAVKALNEELAKSTKLLQANRKAYSSVGTASAKASNSIKTFTRSTQTAATSTNKLSMAVKGLGSALASAAISQKLGNAVGDARQLELSARRLKMLAAEYGQFAGVQEQAARLADKFQLSVTDSSKALFNLGSRLGASGATLTDIVSVYEGLNSALIVTGRSSQEAAAASYQLAQALGSGSLTGDELKTISETLPELLNEIAKAAGKSATEVRQMAKDGELTTDVIIKATQALADKYGPAVEDNIQISQKFSNALGGLSEKIGTSLLPAVNPLQESLTALLNVVISLPDPLIAVGTAATVTAAGLLAIQGALGLLGLPSVIALFAKLATTLAAFSGVTKTVVTGFTVAGAAVKTTTVAVTAQTVALGLLKAAMVTLGWVGFAAGALAAAAATYKAFEAVAEFNRVLNESPIEEIDKKIEELEKELIKAENKTVSWTEAIFDFIIGADGASTAVDGLKNSIDALNRSKIGILDTRPDQGADLDMDEIKRIADIYDPVVTAPAAKKGGGGKAAAAPKTDDLVTLRAEVALKTQLASLQDRINVAELKGDELTATRLEGEKDMLILLDRNASALRGMNTEAGKALQAQINKLDLDAQMVENAKALAQKQTELNEKEQQRLQIIKDTMVPIQDEILLLQAKLDGNEKEIKQKLEILRLEKAIKEAGGTAQDVAGASGMVQERDALRERVEAAQKLEAQYKQLATGISTALTGAFQSVITGAKSAQEALSSAFKGIADAFISAAMRMIQEWLVMQALGMVSSLFGGGPSAAATPLVDGLASQGGSPFGSGGAMPFFGTQQPRMFASGGRPGINQPSVVGERGPELFIPDVAGTIVSSDAFGAARDALTSGDVGAAFDENGEVLGSSSSSSSSVYGGSSSSSSSSQDSSVSNYYNQNGSALAATSRSFAENNSSLTMSNSVLRERAMERESQTTIGGAGSVTIETQVINNVEYATVEQVAKASAASAKQARAQVFSDMKNRPSRRAAVGLR